jgi:hypothetical protein
MDQNRLMIDAIAKMDEAQGGIMKNIWSVK